MDQSWHTYFWSPESGAKHFLTFSSGHLSVCRAPTWHVISERSRPSLVCFSSSTAPWSSLSVSLKTLVLKCLMSPREGGRGLHLGCQATQSWRMASTVGHSWQMSVCPALKVCLFIMSHQDHFPLIRHDKSRERGERERKGGGNPQCYPEVFANPWATCRYFKNRIILYRLFPILYIFLI